MSKFGVGVGDEFPIDDGSVQDGDGNQAPGGEGRRDHEEWRHRRDASRAQDDRCRQQRDGWQRQKHAFKQKVREAARESFGQDWDDRREFRRGGYGHRFPWAIFALTPLLGVLLAIALIAAVIKSPFVFLGLALLGFFFFAGFHHHRGHRFAGHWHHHGGYGDGRDYDFDLKPSTGRQPANSASTTNGAIVTPPPATPATPQDGGK